MTVSSTGRWSESSYVFLSVCKENGSEKPLVIGQNYITHSDLVQLLARRVGIVIGLDQSQCTQSLGWVDTWTVEGSSRRTEGEEVCWVVSAPWFLLSSLGFPPWFWAQAPEASFLSLVMIFAGRSTFRFQNPPHGFHILSSSPLPEPTGILEKHSTFPPTSRGASPGFTSLVLCQTDTSSLGCQEEWYSMCGCGPVLLPAHHPFPLLWSPECTLSLRITLSHSQIMGVSNTDSHCTPYSFFFFFGWEVCENFAPWPGIEPVILVLEGDVIWDGQ